MGRRDAAPGAGHIHTIARTITPCAPEGAHRAGGAREGGQGASLLPVALDVALCQADFPMFCDVALVVFEKVTPPESI